MGCGRQVAGQPGCEGRRWDELTVGRIGGGGKPGQHLGGRWAGAHCRGVELWGLQEGALKARRREGREQGGWVGCTGRGVASGGGRTVVGFHNPTPYTGGQETRTMAASAVTAATAGSPKGLLPQPYHPLQLLQAQRACSPEVQLSQKCMRVLARGVSESLPP